LLIDQIKTSEVVDMLRELQICVQFYTVDGRAYGAFRNWEKHQRVYGHKPKRPAPPAEDQPILTPAFPPQSDSPQPDTPENGPSLAQGESEKAVQSNAQAKVKSLPTPEAKARFDDFWKAYPDRNGKKLDKGETMERFLELSDEEQGQCVLAAKAYKKYCYEAERTPQDPKRFIRGQDGERWRDFIPVKPATPIPKPKPVPVSTGPIVPPDEKSLESLRKLMPGIAEQFEGRA
jgi:hypothetical protein